MSIELFDCMIAMLVPIALYIQYWLIRLAVRAGIEDADRRKHARLVEQQRWKDIQARTE